MGRGVFTTKVLKKGQLIEKSPVILIPCKEKKIFDRGTLARYFYNFGDTGAIALGIGSLFNHSIKPNVYFNVKYREKAIEFRAVRDIKAGKQLFIDYGYDVHKYLKK